MDSLRKRELIRSAGGITLEGVPCLVGGWLDDRVTLVPQFGGIWHTSWESLEQVILGNGNFTAEDVELDQWVWKGPEAPVPTAIKEHFDLAGVT